MKHQKLRNWVCLGALLVMAGLSAGCGLIFVTGAVAVGAVGAVGYTVYKGGESLATGVGDMVSGGDEKQSKNQETVVLSKQALKAECAGSVKDVWLATQRAFQRANFQEPTGNYDLLSGELTAQTWDSKPVSVKMRSVDDHRTTLWIMSDNKGDLSGAERIYSLIKDELKKTAVSAADTKDTP